MSRGLAHAAAVATLAVLVAGSASAGSPLVAGPKFSDVHSFEPAWSPDGRRLAVQRFLLPANRQPPFQIVVMNADRSGPRRVGLGFSPAWSPDGKRVAFVENGPNYARYLSIAAADGSGSRRLFRVEAGIGDRPAWSPDGGSIAFRTGLDISVVRSDGRGLRVLLRDAREPDWSPDGSHIVFSDREGHLEVANADGSGRVPLRTVEPRFAVTPRWSPDAKRIAFVSGTSSDDTAVYIVDVDGTGVSRLTPTTGFSSPTWLPDGEQLAFASSEGEIFLGTVGGSTPVRFTYGGCTVVGTDGADRLNGRPGDDVICSFGGNDTINGGTGDDRILAGAGNDRVLGGAGADTIFGEEGADDIDGGPGADSLHGGADADVIRSRDGQVDLVEGDEGVDRSISDRRDCVVDVERRDDGVPACEPSRSFNVTDDPTWSPDGKRVVFVNEVGKVGTLYSVNADGTGLRRVTPRGFDARWPSWSPDGRTIAFGHEQGVWVIRPDGGGLQLVASDAVQPRWSPRGKKIAFSDGRFRIAAVSPDGTGREVIADPGPETGGEGSCFSVGYYQPTWSPDGEFVAFAVAPGEGGECGYSVYIGASRGPRARVTELAGGWSDEPDWSPDGKRLALVDYGGETFNVGIVDLRTHRTRYLREGWHPRWSPDGKQLVFARGKSYGTKKRSSIYVMYSDGSRLRRITP